MINDTIKDVNLIPVGPGYAKTCINTVIFRMDPISTYQDTQYVSYYKYKNQLVLAKRKLNSNDWEYLETKFKGKVKDAHNSISIIHDGKGILHISWNHHNDPINYIRTVSPDSLNLTGKLSMTGFREKKLCYPEFYRDSKGNLYFFYRVGGSGRGDLNLKGYNSKTGIWEDIQNDFIDGEGERNAYWQIFVDVNDTIHISWCWRETNDASTNHDICYAKSEDGGKTWLKSSGEIYSLPITQKNAEIVCPIPQDRDLMNQTSMVVNSAGNIYITTFWRPKGKTIPQTMIVYYNGKTWNTMQVGRRSIPFRLKGTGTLTNPMGPPKIIVDDQDRVYVIIREEERKNRITAVCCEDISNPQWIYKDLTNFSVETYEPSYDSTLWKEKKLLHLFVQTTGDLKQKKYKKWKESMVYVLEWYPSSIFENV
jgi:BNR repeat-containing family member